MLQVVLEKSLEERAEDSFKECPALENMVGNSVFLI